MKGKLDNNAASLITKWVEIKNIPSKMTLTFNGGVKHFLSHSL
jgi:hypothetical protein